MTVPNSVACLSIRQPWARLFALGIKPVENRTWYCSHRGPLLVHASRTYGQSEVDAYDGLLHAALDRGDRERALILAQARNQRGGLVGVVNMVGCVTRDVWFHKMGRGPFNGYDEWFVGPYGFLVRDPRPFEFFPYKGRQGLFRVPVRAVPGLAEIVEEMR